MCHATKNTRNDTSVIPKIREDTIRNVNQKRRQAFQPFNPSLHTHAHTHQHTLVHTHNKIECVDRHVTEQGIDTSTFDASKCHFYKLPYIGFYSTYTGKKISSMINKDGKDLNVKVIFSPFKLSAMFSPEDFIPESLKSHVAYQFTCASCGPRYFSETNRHFRTRANEHLFRDKNSHVFKRLNCSRHCRDSFKIIDFARTFSQLKIKESFLIERLNPELNKQVEHVNLSLHF